LPSFSAVCGATMGMSFRADVAGALESGVREEVGDSRRPPDAEEGRGGPGRPEATETRRNALSSRGTDPLGFARAIPRARSRTVRSRRRPQGNRSERPVAGAATVVLRDHKEQVRQDFGGVSIL